MSAVKSALLNADLEVLKDIHPSASLSASSSSAVPPKLLAYQNALQLYCDHKYEKAILGFTEALPEFRGHASDVPVELTLLARAKCWQALDNHSRAVEDLTDALQYGNWENEDVDEVKRKRKCKIFVSRSISFISIKRSDAALKDFDAAQELDPNDSSIFSGRASLFMYMQQFEQALQSCRLAIQLDSKNYVAYQHLGMIHAQLNQISEAISSFDKALKLEPHYETYILRGKAYSSTGNTLKALEDFSAAVELKPQLPLAYGNRAALYAQLGRIDKAIEDASKWIERSPEKDAVSAHHARGIWRVELKRFTEAVDDFTQVLKVDPRHLIARCARATSYAQIHEYNKSIADWLKVIQSHQQFARAYWSIGECYVAKKDYSAAVKFYTEALRLDQKNKNVYLLRAKAYSELSMRNHAINDLNHAIKLDPLDPPLYHERAYEYIMLNQLEKALHDLNSAINMAPYVPEHYEKRATIFHKLRLHHYGRTDVLQAKRLRRRVARSSHELTKEIAKLQIDKKKFAQKLEKKVQTTDEKKGDNGEAEKKENTSSVSEQHETSTPDQEQLTA